MTMPLATLLRAALLVPLALGTACTATPATAVEAQAEAPAAAARDFYRWYLGTMASATEPAAADYTRTVSRALRDRLAAERASGEAIDEDYFTKSQDYLDDWLDNIAVGDVDTSGRTAQSLVSLGDSADPWRLAVTLILEDGHWKIDRVEKR